MKCYDFDWQINEFMIYCRSTQLRDRTMYSYEQTLRLFERWCLEQMDITTVDKVPWLAVFPFSLFFHLGIFLSNRKKLGIIGQTELHQHFHHLSLLFG